MPGRRSLSAETTTCSPSESPLRTWYLCDARRAHLDRLALQNPGIDDVHVAIRRLSPDRAAGNQERAGRVVHPDSDVDVHLGQQLG